MRRSSLLGFVFLNVVVTFATVFAAVGFMNRFSPQPTPRNVAPPLVVVVTSTPDPNRTEVQFIVVTATPMPGAATSIGENTANSSGTNVETNTDVAVAGVPTSTRGAPPTADLGAIPTLDPSLLPPDLGNNNSANGTPSASGTPSSGCQEYKLKDGDTAGKIAQTFGVSLDDMMNANHLTEKDLTRLQIGQTLIIPINGCGLATDEPTPTITPTHLDLPTLPPTSTIAPTASSAQIEVVQVVNPGDITSEAVILRNISGGVIQMKNWTLADGTGLKFTFPDYRMFPGGRVTIFTKTGTNTPIVLYWGQARAVWGTPNQQITIADANGEVQTTYSLAEGNSSDSANAIPTPTAGS